MEYLSRSLLFFLCLFVLIESATAQARPAPRNQPQQKSVIGKTLNDISKKKAYKPKGKACKKGKKCGKTRNDWDNLNT